MLQKRKSLIRVVILPATLPNYSKENIAGNLLQPQQRKYLDCNRRILATVNEYAKRETLEYLRRISHNIGFWSRI